MHNEVVIMIINIDIDIVTNVGGYIELELLRLRANLTLQDLIFEPLKPDQACALLLVTF
jgi:hypothetical protein